MTETSNRLDRVLRIRSKTTTVYDRIMPYLVVYDHNLRIMTDPTSFVCSNSGTLSSLTLTLFVLSIFEIIKTVIVQKNI